VVCFLFFWDFFRRCEAEASALAQAGERLVTKALLALQTQLDLCPSRVFDARDWLSLAACLGAVEALSGQVSRVCQRQLERTQAAAVTVTDFQFILREIDGLTDTTSDLLSSAARKLRQLAVTDLPLHLADPADFDYAFSLSNASPEERRTAADEAYRKNISRLALLRDFSKNMVTPLIRSTGSCGTEIWRMLSSLTALGFDSVVTRQHLSTLVPERALFLLAQACHSAFHLADPAVPTWLWTEEF
jgi:hypothetical protein